MEPIKLWQNLSNEDQALARRIQIAALVLYVFLQIVNFLLPLAITAIIALVYTKNSVSINLKSNN